MDDYDVIVAGGGYAGLMCALRLGGGRQGLKIALINPRAAFIERLRLHEGLTGEHATMRRLDIGRTLAAAGVDFLAAEVTGLEREARRVEITADGRCDHVGYRRLVIAVGSATRRDAIPGADAHAFSLDQGERGAGALEEALSTCAAPRVLVIGGGATGIEAAAGLASRPGAMVTLVDSRAFGGFTSPRVAQVLRKRLDAAGVRLLSGIRVERLDAGLAETSAGPIHFDLCLVAGGFSVPPLPGAAELPTSGDGRLLVDPALRSLGDPLIYAAGDAAMPVEPCGAPPRMSVFFALATGAFVAKAISDELAGRQPRRFEFWTYGQAIGLGGEAVGFATIPFDRPVGPLYTGGTGYWLRHFFVWLLFQLLRVEARIPGLPFYLGQSMRRLPLDARQ